MVQRLPGIAKRRGEAATIIVAKVAFMVIPVGNHHAFLGQNLAKELEMDSLVVHQNAIKVEDHRLDHAALAVAGASDCPGTKETHCRLSGKACLTIVGWVKPTAFSGKLVGCTHCCTHPAKRFPDSLLLATGQTLLIRLPPVRARQCGCGCSRPGEG